MSQPNTLIADALRIQQFDYSLHGLGNTVFLCERITREYGVEHWAGDQMLRKHFNGLILGDRGIQVILQLGQKLLENFNALWVCRILDNGSDACDVILGDSLNIAGPVLPILPRAAALHDPGVHCLGDFALKIQHALHGARGRRLAADPSPPPGERSLRNP